MAGIVDETEAYRQLLEQYGIPYKPELIRQLDIFMQALRIHETRSVYGQSWRRYGALSNLLSVARKADRLMQVFWFGRGGLEHKDAVDDAYDLINYTAFFIRNFKDENWKGQS